MEMERELTLGSEPMVQCADDNLLSCTLETCMVLLTSVTPINSIREKKSLHSNFSFLHL